MNMSEFSVGTRKGRLMFTIGNLQNAIITLQSNGNNVSSIEIFEPAVDGSIENSVPTGQVLRFPEAGFRSDEAVAHVVDSILADFGPGALIRLNTKKTMI